MAPEVGTMRIDVPGKSGVADENLKSHGYENLYVCDLSIFTFSPMANPSLTLTAFAMRLGDHLSNLKSESNLNATSSIEIGLESAWKDKAGSPFEPPPSLLNERQQYE